MPAIKDWLQTATNQLSTAGISSAKLDAEIILAHTIRHNRTYLHAHDDELLTSRHQEIADARLQVRLDRTPIAYIIGHKEFYGRLFRVTPATLIPRPESEMIITIVKKLLNQTSFDLSAGLRRLVDVGTGSGCLGISAKLESPELDVTLLDISRHALTIAQANAQTLAADVTILRSDLLASYPLAATIMIANLPYVDPSWERSPETEHEPEQALFAGRDGLAMIEKLIEQAPSHIEPGGHLLLEADPRQHVALIHAAAAKGFIHCETRDFIVCLQRP